MAHRAQSCAFRLWILCASALVPVYAWAVPTGSVTLDGSYGTSGALTGPNYQVTAAMGMLKGNNLFQSFGTFNLVHGESATFSGPANVQNILARVTGGSPSSIDGTINSSILGANLFLLNSARVMFGPNAQVNVTGSFMVGTPNYVKLSDGGMFYTSLGGNDNLTSAPVSAFGFMPGATPQPVSFTGSQLTMAPATGLHVISGDITLTNGAYLLSPGGNLSFFSAAGSGEVPFSLTPTPTQYSTAATTVSKRGNISLTQNSQAEIDGDGGGSIVIRGGKLTVAGTNGASVATGGGVNATTNSNFTSGNFANVPGGNISADVDNLSLSDGGYISTDTFGGAQGGSINVKVAGKIDITGSGSEISARTDSAGNGGDLTVTASSINLDDGVMFASTNTSGNAGTVEVTAGSMSMEGISRLSSISDGAGNSGDVTLTLTGPLTMSDQAGIIANTYVSGQGGNVSVMAPQITMSGLSLISANTALSSGNGGQVTVVTNSLSIQGTGSVPFGSLGITAQSELAASGNGGVVDVTAGTLSLGGGAVISSASVFNSTGNAGVVNVTAGALSLDTGAEISSASFLGSSGNAGSVSVSTSQGSLGGGSLISASSDTTNAGTVQVMATDSFTLSGSSSISTSAGKNGGDITLRVNRLLYLSNSNIQAFAGVGQQVGGIGGNILIDPQFVILDNSLISANDLSPGGQDGNITNLANFFFTSDSILHATGTIVTTPPDLDLGESLVALPANLDSAASQLRERCEQAVNHEFSTFILVGRGGIESAPGELQSDFGLSSNLPNGEKGE